MDFREQYVYQRELNRKRFSKVIESGDTNLIAKELDKWADSFLSDAPSLGMYESNGMYNADLDLYTALFTANNDRLTSVERLVLLYYNNKL